MALVVSVILPTYDRAHCLARCVDSVLARRIETSS
jgi:glycosyltransferase involved in cell wall biosynthesis